MIYFLVSVTFLQAALWESWTRGSKNWKWRFRKWALFGWGKTSVCFMTLPPQKKPTNKPIKRTHCIFPPLIYLFFSSFGWRSDDLMPCRGICRLSICSQFTSLVLIKWSPNGSSYKLCSGQGRVCVCVCFFWLFFAKLYELWWIASQMNLTDVLVSGFLFEAPINPQLNVIL